MAESQQTEKLLMSPKAASIEKMCKIKSDILMSWGNNWERCKWISKGVSRRNLLKSSSSEWGWLGQFDGSEEREVLYIWPDAKDLRDFVRLCVEFKRGFESPTSNRVKTQLLVTQQR